MGLTDIQEEISRRVRQLGDPEAERAVKECITRIKDLILDCGVCASEAFGSCSSCVAAQRAIGEALEWIRKSEKKKKWVR